MKIVTRFAPSPTGLLHIGGARTALFNYLFAKHNKGDFLLRIEDTDKKRSTQEAVQAILDGLEWLGLKNDGEVFYQSKNEHSHKEVALKLLENGKAYYCYTSAEELDFKRKEAESKGEVFRFKSPWRDSQSNPPSDIKPVIRLKAPTQGFTIVNDLVQGEVKVANIELDDLVILRGDGTPTYNLAVVVDDHQMAVTHIIRGDDHLNNAFKQKLIYEAMNWPVPQFAHIPLIHGSDGAKMSKRHGATGVMEYKDMGYLPQALRNYLLRLGWSHGDAEIISDDQAIEWFNLEKIGKSPARFDFDKLNNLNKHYIKELSSAKLLDLIGFSKDAKNSAIEKALSFVKERANNLNELKDAAILFQNGFEKELSEQDKILILEKTTILKLFEEAIHSLDNWNLDLIKNSLLNCAASQNLKMKDFGPALRVILTFSSSSAGGVFEIMEILGKEEVLRRFKLNLK